MERVMPIYRQDEEGKLNPGNLRGVPRSTPTLLSGGGGLYSSISDYARFAQMILNEGELNGARLVGPKTVRMMLTNQLSDAQMEIRSVGPGRGFGLGFSVVIDPAGTRTLTSEGAAGWSGINNTFFTVDPEEELLFILMTQFSPYNYYDIQDKFQVLVYQSLIN
jgi:CubicO group peptidase (beta-lactamase class C family)